MSNKFLKFTVIFLAVLIFICFAFLLYGLYSKISNTQVLSNGEITNYSLNLSNTGNIKDVKIIDENNILVVVSDHDQIYLIIYSLDQNKVMSKIER